MTTNTEKKPEKLKRSPNLGEWDVDIDAFLKDAYEKYKYCMKIHSQFFALKDIAHKKKSKMFEIIRDLSTGWSRMGQSHLDVGLAVAGVSIAEIYHDPYGTYPYEGYALRPTIGESAYIQDPVCLILGEEVKAQVDKAKAEGFVPAPVMFRGT